MAEARPNSAIFRGLAQAMGYTDSAFYEDDETILRNFVEDAAIIRFTSR